MIVGCFVGDRHLLEMMKVSRFRGFFSLFNVETSKLFDFFSPAGQVLQIVVPAGVSSGQALSVTVPEGPQVTFTVPPGVQAGSQLELWYDPTTGSVSPLV